MDYAILTARRTRFRPLPATLMAALVSLAAAGAAGGQAAAGASGKACPEGRISTIFVDNHSIYDLEQVEASGAARRFYRLANSIHMKTRESFIRSELLFREGDCFDPFLVAETGRILRSYPFLARADVFAVTQPDGSRHVIVDTQDEWTTKLDLGVTFDRGLNLETFDLTEEDFLGRGIRTGLFLHQRKERRDIGFDLGFPRVLGTRTNAFISAGSTRVGRFLDESVSYPFVGEVGRFSVIQRYGRRDELFPYALDGGSEFSHVLLPYLDDRVGVSVAGRLGRPGHLTVLGVGITRETLDFDGFPTNAETARNSDFGHTAPAPASLADRVAGQVTSSSTTRVNLLVGQRNLHFVRAHGLDPLNGTQDVQLGSDVGLTLGRSLDGLAAAGLAPSNDVYARGRLFLGAAPGSSYVFFNGSLEGRRLQSDTEGTAWRDVIGEADLYAYVRSRRAPRHTFFARVSGAGGWSTVTPFQLTLGGRTSLRGFREEEFPGARRLIATLEDRVFLPWPAPDILDFGFTAFADFGRVWKGDAPFSATSRWKGTVGGGIRLGLPTGSRVAARMDLAFPLLDTNHRTPVFRITLFDLLGLDAGFTDPQLDRSRRLTVGPDSFTQQGG